MTQVPCPRTCQLLLGTRCSWLIITSRQAEEDQNILKQLNDNAQEHSVMQFVGDLEKAWPGI